MATEGTGALSERVGGTSTGPSPSPCGVLQPLSPPVETALLSYALGTGHKKVADLLSDELRLLGHRCDHRPLEEWVPWDYDLLFRHGYLFVALKTPAAWDFMYRSPSFTRRGVLAPPLMADRPVRRFEEQGFGGRDLVVATQYNAMEIAADWKRSTGRDLKLAVVVTDYDIYPLWARPEVDLFLVPHQDLKALLVQRGVPESRVLPTGIPISPVFEGLRRDPAVRASLGLPEEGPVAMVFGGGGGWGPMAEAVEACLSAEGWRVMVVCGKNERLRRRLERLSTTVPGRLCVLGYRQDVPQLMCACDVVVTKGGGLSLTEAVYSGTRTIALSSLPGQERVNVAFMEGKGWVERCDRVGLLGQLLARHPKTPPEPRDLPPRPAKTAACALDWLARS
jgi:processive 1,2-diacylglycerol beta-glucosyltransferase